MRSAGRHVILASNTSSLPVTAIAARTKHPERCGGMHFFNPVPLMRLVEVIPGLKTAQWVTDALMTIGRRMTREPVLCVDSPGFLVNHIGRGLGPETQRILQEGIATIDEIDRILTGAPGFRMGPFTLGDMVGIDVGNAAMASMYEQFFHEPAYAPSPLMALRAAGGLYGQKTGSGLVHLRGRQEGRAGAEAGTVRAPEVGVGAPERPQPGSPGAVPRVSEEPRGRDRRRSRRRARTR